MAAAISALNAKIRSRPVLSYFCSTHFWGPASNFGIPLAAVMDIKKDPEIISGRMTAALTLYSATFMRYALAVTPRNGLLFACHFINFGSQLTQGWRYMQYWHYGGRETSLAALSSSSSSTSQKITTEIEDTGRAALNEGKQLYQDAKDVLGK